MKKHFLLAGIAALMLAACNNKPASELTLSGLDPAKFQTEVNNAQTALYTLKNKAGMEVCITNFGGRIVSIMVPDKNGKMRADLTNDGLHLMGEGYIVWRDAVLPYVK